MSANPQLIQRERSHAQHPSERSQPRSETQLVALRSTPTHLSVRKIRRVPPSWPVAAGEGFERTRPEGGRPGRPAIFAEPWMANQKSPGEARPAARRAINKRPRTRPFIDGSPQAWPRGWQPPALAPTRQGTRPSAMPKASPPHEAQQKKWAAPAHPAGAPPGPHRGKWTAAACGVRRVTSVTQCTAARSCRKRGYPTSESRR